MAPSAPVSSREQRGTCFRRRSGGLQTGQRDGRERTRCPVAPAFRGRLLFANPEGSEGSAFCPGTSAKPSSKSCPSPRTNTSTPTTPIPCAKPSAPPTNSPSITRRLSPHLRIANRHLIRIRPQLPRQHRTHLPPPNRTGFISV